MVITFPHMGNIYFAAKALFDDLQIDYVIPPMSSKSSLEIGSLHSPEEMCLPFKIMIGNYIHAIEKGADTIIITGSCGPCRFGEYCELQMNLLSKLGHKLDFLVVDSPGDIGVQELFSRLGRISQSSSLPKAKKLKALSNAVKVVRLIDEIEAKARYQAGFEKNKGECKGILRACKEEAMTAQTGDDMLRILNRYKKQLESLPLVMAGEAIKIAIIGEIYTIIEPFSNLYIEDRLMDYGISTQRTLSPSWWLKNLVLSPTGLNQLDIKRKAKEYLPYMIGGHARECIGETLLAHEAGFDGAIQIFPMGCMPEIVSKAILPKISKDKDFPILTLVVDEMTGEAGYVTRIEAFMDLLERRKTHVLSRC